MHLRLNHKYQSDSEVLRILNYQIGICRDYLCLGDPSRISDSFLNFILSLILLTLQYYKSESLLCFTQSSHLVI